MSSPNQRHDLHELPVDQIPGVEVHQRVGAARHEDAEPLPIQLRRADLVPVDAIAAVVAPARGIAALDPVDARDLLPGHPVEHGEVFGAFQDESAVGDRGRFLRGRVRRHLERHLRLAVAVEVAGDERRPPDAHVHVPPEVVAPHERAGPAVVRLELERVGAGADGAGIQPVSRAWLLDDVVEHAVPVEIADADAVEQVIALQLDGAHAVGRRARTERRGLRRRQFTPVDHAADKPGVLLVHRGRRVHQVRAGGDRPGVDLDGSAVRRAPVDVEGDARWIRFQQPPADIRLAGIVRHRDQPAIERLFRWRGSGHQTGHQQDTDPGAPVSHRFAPAARIRSAARRV